ncbi:hypothetical protein [Roseateles violae]|uniref:Uncharacterized protein n=1 Tax=Roseateles violae TaxID=3058042 RepID=A0ABT8E0J8_9BURK|nr:hypothetical protein [Pelomonas sp. PFR6]MDN3923323.1 hypothetical protein [Pelomonas sp. PFR6]
MLAVYLPQNLPKLSTLLRDFSSPSAANLGRAFGVSRSTAHRWISEDRAPLSVLMVLYLAAPSYGAAETHNRVQHAQEGQRLALALVDSLNRALDDLRREFGRVLAVGDFGAANAPSLDAFPRPSAEVLPFQQRA